MNKEHFLLQRFIVGTNDVQIDHVRSVAYIETASMEGVKLIIELMDHVGTYRDDFGIKEHTEIELSFSEPFNKDGLGDTWIEKFVVVKAPVANGVITINAFAKSTHDLKQPATKPQFFNNKQPSQILAALLPSLKVDADTFELGSTYHLNAGGTKARLIRSMARDYGAVCFICRGVVYFKKLSGLTKTPDFKMEQGNPSADYSISRFKMIADSALYERVLDKNYLSWDTVEGLQVAKNALNAPSVMVSVPQGKSLNNQHFGLIPLLEVELLGDSRLTPLSCCSVQFHKLRDQLDLDESIPEIQYINQVTHYQRGNRYLCAVELAEVHK